MRSLKGCILVSHVARWSSDACMRRVSSRRRWCGTHTPRNHFTPPITAPAAVVTTRRVSAASVIDVSKQMTDVVVGVAPVESYERRHPVRKSRFDVVARNLRQVIEEILYHIQRGPKHRMMQMLVK